MSQEEAQGKSYLVVEKRAEKVAAEYVRKAQQTAQAYCGTAPGTVGPFEANTYIRTSGNHPNTIPSSITLSTQAT